MDGYYGSPQQTQYHGQILVLSPQHGVYITYPYPSSPAYGMMYACAPVMTPPMGPPRVLFRRDQTTALLPDPPTPASPHPLLTPVAVKHRQKLAQQFAEYECMPPCSPAHSSRQSESPAAPPPSPASATK